MSKPSSVRRILGMIMPSFARLVVHNQSRQIVEAENDVLRRHDDRRPLAGCRMLLVDIISTRASSCASSDSGT